MHAMRRICDTLKQYHDQLTLCFENEIEVKIPVTESVDFTHSRNPVT